jgi:hypothetical protein
MKEKSNLNIIRIDVFRSLLYVFNLLDDNVGSLRVFDDPLTRPTFIDGRVSGGLTTEAMYSRFFGHTLCLIKMIE